MSLDRVALSSRSLGYGQAMLDVIQTVNDGADISRLDKATLLWVLEKVDGLRKSNELRGDAARAKQHTAA